MQDQDGAALTATDPIRPRPAGRSRRLRRLVAVTALVGLAVDQSTKAWALNTLVPGETRPLVGDWITLDLIRNSGAAFSLGEGMTWIFTIVSVGVLLGIAWTTATKLNSMAYAVGFGLIAGGALGNLVDRLVREPGFGRGHVVDFIGYFDWFVGNVADIVIVLAAGYVAVVTFLGYTLDGAPRGRAPDMRGS